MGDEVKWRPMTPEALPGGRWVPAARMHPQCNVYGRAWRTPDGRSGICYGADMWRTPGASEGVEWYFPPDLAAFTEVPKVRHVPLRLRMLLGMPKGLDTSEP